MGGEFEHMMGFPLPWVCLDFFRLPLLSANFYW